MNIFAATFYGSTNGNVGLRVGEQFCSMSKYLNTGWIKLGSDISEFSSNATIKI